ncbi:MAG: hypothetical protein J6R85_05425 [Lentisphaeria bacterium]|nr:hypothetical protein [Lentisphaeria bacterium]
MDHLYLQDQQKPFESIFANPSSLYRDTPFWAWNCELNEDMLRRQIGIFQEMGMGGFHMHSRTGTVTPYLSEEYMDLVDDCVDEAGKRNMLAWLYDEDRWPSGAAGGIVTRDPKFRGRYLQVRFSRRTEPVETDNDNSGTFLASYAVKLDENGCLAEYRRCGEDDPAADGEIRIWCYMCINPMRDWFNNLCYVDTLNPEAIRKFVEVTHETYFRKVGSEFGKVIPAVFTDEPNFARKESLTFAREERDLQLPYTNDLPETYRQAYGEDFFSTFPELLWELPDGKYSLARYRYHDHVAERFAAGFADVVGKWCEEHGIQSSGHLLEEPTLHSQTSVLGDCMRSYRSFQLPGIDMLCDRMEFSTAKQAQSASRQYGRGGVLSELDGVTDWDFSFIGHKAHGDWQAALGVTVRVPHLSWVSMAGEAKRDYPASISYQSPWYRQYPLLADHFARVNAAMTRGKAVAHVAVVHPVESYWLLYGPQDQTAVARSQAEENFNNIFHFLLSGLIDFDLLGESLLPGQNVHVEGKSLCVGEMRYDTVVVPPCLTLRSSTLQILEDFRAAGGEVIFAGEAATLCDAQPSARAAALAAQCTCIPYSRAALLDALDHRRDLRVLDVKNGYPTDKLLYQLREEGDTGYLFLTSVERYGCAFAAKIMLRGEWDLEILNTSDGTIAPLASSVEHGWTVFYTDFYPHDHRLLRRKPRQAPAQCSMPGGREVADRFNDAVVENRIAMRLPGRSVPVTLDEPNVLLLDIAQWRVNGGSWQPEAEILRLNDLARKELGVPPVDQTQPWAQKISGKVYGTLEIRYTIESRIAVAAPELALEQPESTRIFWDGTEIPFADCGWWTDESLRKTRLPDLAAGSHELILRREYSDKTNVERAYLLGDFGVEVRGDFACITEPVRTLCWGDAARQGLPFYGGNIIYHLEFEVDDAFDGVLHIPSRISDPSLNIRNYMQAREISFCAFAGTLLGVALDGKALQPIAFAPFETSFGTLARGKHTLDLTLYGHRQNAFAANHLLGRVPWTGPFAWRTRGNQFSMDYLLAPIGILRSPMILR